MYNLRKLEEALKDAGFEVPTAVVIKCSVFWDITP
jgi:hypothetical protein